MVRMEMIHHGLLLLSTETFTAVDVAPVAPGSLLVVFQLAVLGVEVLGTVQIILYHVITDDITAIWALTDVAAGGGLGEVGDGHDANDEKEQMEYTCHGMKCSC